jgi:predicted alpha/beta-fold hydrolase
MFESLASSRRQDRVLHGVAKLGNLLLGAVLTPLWLLGQWLAGPVRRLLALVDGETSPLPVPAPRERSMNALIADLAAIPHRLRPSRTAQLRKGLADWSTFIVAQQRDGVGLGYSYPKPFLSDRFEGADGEPIAATVALHDDPRPGLVVVHGLFSNRRFDYVREIAVRAHFEWGFNVAAIDLRSFGLTALLSRAPSTAGWKEGEDIVRAGRQLKDLGATSVGALGISLGASSVLNASHSEGAAEALDGGVLAICGPADTRRAAERLSRRVPPGHPAYLFNRLFTAMLTSRVRSAGWPAEVRCLTDAVESVSAPYYEVTAHEIWERSSAVNNIARASVPVLVLHSEDDLIIKVEHARMLADAARGNDNVGVWIVPGGAHFAFDVLDRRWAYAVYRSFFERWARYRSPGPEGRAAPAAAEMVYSAPRGGHAETAGRNGDT